MSVNYLHAFLIEEIDYRIENDYGFKVDENIIEAIRDKLIGDNKFLDYDVIDNTIEQCLKENKPEEMLELELNEIPFEILIMPEYVLNEEQNDKIKCKIFVGDLAKQFSSIVELSKEEIADFNLQTYITSTINLIAQQPSLIEDNSNRELYAQYNNLIWYFGEEKFEQIKQFALK